MTITKKHIILAIAALALLANAFLFYRVEQRLNQQEQGIMQIVNFINQQIQAQQQEAPNPF